MKYVPQRVVLTSDYCKVEFLSTWLRLMLITHNSVCTRLLNLCIAGTKGENLF
jgi:hypothetical protein